MISHQRFLRDPGRKFIQGENSLTRTGEMIVFVALQNEMNAVNNERRNKAPVQQTISEYGLCERRKRNLK